MQTVHVSSEEKMSTEFLRSRCVRDRFDVFDLDAVLKAEKKLQSGIDPMVDQQHFLWNWKPIAFFAISNGTLVSMWYIWSPWMVILPLMPWIGCLVFSWFLQRRYYKHYDFDSLWYESASPTDEVDQVRHSSVDRTLSVPLLETHTIHERRRSTSSTASYSTESVQHKPWIPLLAPIGRFCCIAEIELLELLPCKDASRASLEYVPVRRLPAGWTFAFLMTAHFFCAMAMLIFNTAEQVTHLSMPVLCPKTVEGSGNRCQGVHVVMLCFTFLQPAVMYYLGASFIVAAAQCRNHLLRTRQKRVADLYQEELQVRLCYKNILGGDTFEQRQERASYVPAVIAIVSVATTVFPGIVNHMWPRTLLEAAWCTLSIATQSASIYIVLQVLRCGVSHLFLATRSRLQLVTILLQRVLANLPLSGNENNKSAEQDSTQRLEKQILRWWRIRDILVHVQLPMVYDFCSWPLSMALCVVLASIGFITFVVFSQGLAGLAWGNYMQALCVGVCFLLLTNAAFVMAVQLYNEQQRHFDLILSLSTFASSEEVRDLCFRIARHRDQDLYPRVFGLSIKPQMLTLLWGYAGSAALTAAARSLSR